MKVAVLIAPKNFKDESVSRAKTMLEKWGVEPVISSYSTHDCVGYHGATYPVGLNAAKVRSDDFDALLLMDGPGVDSYKLYDFRTLLDLVKAFSMKGKPVAAIGNAVKIVARANVINGVKVSVPNDRESMRLAVLFKGVVSEKPMESDKNIMTLSNSDGVEQFLGMMLEKMGAK